MERGLESGIGSGLSYQYLSALMFEAFGAAFYVIITKTLSTTYVGVITLILAISSLLNIVFSFGVPISAQHFVSYYKGRRDFAEMWGLSRTFIIIGTLLALSGVAFSLLTAKTLASLFFHNVTYYPFIYMASFYIGAGIIFGVLHGITLGHQMFRADGIIYLLSASLSYLVGLLFLLIFHSVLYVFVGFGLSYLYGSIIYVVLLFNKEPSIKEKKSKTPLPKILGYSWPIILSSLIGYGSTYVDRFVVAYFLSLSTLGIYGFALTISASLAFFSGPLVNILIPKLSEYFSANDKDKLRWGVNLSSALMILIYSPITLGVASIAPLVLSLLARSIYITGTIALIILLGISSLFILWSVFSSVIYAIGKTKIYILSTSITLMSNVALSFLLIPRVGMTGAAIANSSVSVISFIITYYYSIVREAIDFDWVTIIKIWSCSFTMFVAVTLERITIGNRLVFLPFYVASGAVVYLVSLNLTNSLSRYRMEEFLAYIPERYNLKKTVKVLLSRAF